LKVSKGQSPACNFLSCINRREEKPERLLHRINLKDKY